MKLKYVKALVAVTVALGVLLPSTISHAKSLAAAHHLVTAAEAQARHTAEAINQARNQATAQDQALLANPRRLTIHHHRFRLKRSLRKRQAHQTLKNRQAPFPALHQK